MAEWWAMLLLVWFAGGFFCIPVLLSEPSVKSLSRESWLALTCVTGPFALLIVGLICSRAHRHRAAQRDGQDVVIEPPPLPRSWRLARTPRPAHVIGGVATMSHGAAETPDRSGRRETFVASSKGRREKGNHSGDGGDMEQMRHLNIAVEEVDEAGLRFHAHPNGAEETLPEAIVQNEEDGLQERLAVLGVPPSINVHDYLAKDDDPRKPVELVFGAIRPIAPLCPEYEPLLVRLLRRVSGYLESKGVGQAYITPMEVVLSTERSLVVRPHVAVVLNEKRGIVRNQVLWGAPHVVVEFSWDATSRRVHTMKARWYGFYGVQELWCVDPRDRRIEVIDMRSNPGLRPHMFRGATPIQSRMLPGIPLCANHIFRPGAEELDEPYQPSTSSVLGLGII